MSKKTEAVKELRSTSIKPVMTEKAVMLLEAENTLVFQANLRETKEEIKAQIEDIFDVKIEKIRTTIRKNKKYAYVKLKGDTLAIDIATKLGLM